jgi:hypothetical protein
LAGSPASHAAGLGLEVLGVVCPLSREDAERLVAEMAYAEASEDICAAALKELTAESAAGVWQEFALLNHSCAPNTCAALFGVTLVVGPRGACRACCCCKRACFGGRDAALVDRGFDCSCGRLTPASCAVLTGRAEPCFIIASSLGSTKPPRPRQRHARARVQAQVRAAAPILAGEELTACYLGERRLAPVRERRAALRANYGFHCQVGGGGGREGAGGAAAARQAPLAWCGHRRRGGGGAAQQLRTAQGGPFC